MIYLLHLWATTDRPDNDILEHIARIALKYKVNHVRVEDNFGDGMFTQLLMPVLARIYKTKDGNGCSVDGVRHSIRKERRILGTLEPPMNAHRLVVDRKVVEWDHESTDSEAYRLFFQLTRMQDLAGALLHDDRIDALTMAVAYWNELGALSTDFREDMEALSEWEEEQELMDFMAEEGVPVRERTWLSHNRSRGRA
jgi:hypothetical protein